MIRKQLEDVGIDEATDAWINEVFTNFDSNNSYKKQYESFQKRLSELTEKRNKIVGDNAAKSGRSNFNPNPPEAIAIDNEMRRIKNSQEYKVARVVANFSEDKIKEAQGHLINAYNAEANLIEEQTNEMRKVQKAEGRYTTSTTSTSFDFTDENRDKVNELIRQYLTGSSGNYVSQLQWKAIEVNKEIEESEIQAADVIEEEERRKRKEIEETNKALEKQKSILDLQVSSISSFGSALSDLGNTFDNTGLKAAGIIAQAIANIIKGYSEASAQSATLGPWAWAAFSLAGLAQVTSVISQIHSLSGYASGGIIQGANTIGDYNLARVNSGEMILNGTQQARLFSLLNSPISGNNVSASNQVEFKIKGQDLVGIITNYNKKVGRVL